jgi:hypothetical protein
MADLPEGMLQRQRYPVKHFNPDEQLYRRIMPGAVVNGRVTIDSIELPDMSVNRGSLGEPEWVLLPVGDFPGWGIATFRVQDIPEKMVLSGVLQFTFKPVHVPLKHNYPHSEVRAFENGAHIDGKQRLLDHGLHLRWRHKLLMRTRIHKMPKPVDPSIQPARLN